MTELTARKSSKKIKARIFRSSAVFLIASSLLSGCSSVSEIPVVGDMIATAQSEKLEKKSVSDKEAVSEAISVFFDSVGVGVKRYVDNPPLMPADDAPESEKIAIEEVFNDFFKEASSSFDGESMGQTARQVVTGSFGYLYMIGNQTEIRVSPSKVEINKGVARVSSDDLSLTIDGIKQKGAEKSTRNASVLVLKKIDGKWLIVDYIPDEKKNKSL